jgi:hypothetical protein
MIDGDILTCISGPLAANGNTWMVDCGALTTADGTLTADGSILANVGCTLMSDGCTLMDNDHALTIDRCQCWLPWTIDQKWIADHLFNWDSKFCMHADTEKEPCVSDYFIHTELRAAHLILPQQGDHHVWLNQDPSMAQALRGFDSGSHLGHPVG